MTPDQKKPPFRLALITGASSGIGQALCYLLAKKRINLMITGHNTANLQQVADDLRPLVNVAIYPANLANPIEREQLIERIRELVPDLVINNAGFGLYGDAINFPTQEQAEILQVNVNALFEISLEAGRTLVEAKQPGVILNVSSAAAFQPMPGFAAYAASKAFVTLFSEALNEEMKKHGIHVLASCPGQVATKFRARASKGQAPKASPPMTMTLDFAVNEIWKQIEQRKPVHIFDWRYRLATFLTRYLIPRSLMMRIISKNIAKRSK